MACSSSARKEAASLVTFAGLQTQRGLALVNEAELGDRDSRDTCRALESREEARTRYLGRRAMQHRAAIRTRLELVYRIAGASRDTRESAAISTA